MLLLPKLTLPPAVMGVVEVKAAGEVTVAVLTELVPNYALPDALKALVTLTATGALAETAVAALSLCRQLLAPARRQAREDFCTGAVSISI